MNPAIPAIAADETFNDTWPFHARYNDAPGFQTIINGYKKLQFQSC